MRTSQQIGKMAEACACRYLIAQGLVLLKQNYHSRYGEIDLIMLDQSCLCFIEVKARQARAWSTAIEQVHAAKQQKTILTAQFFLQQYPTYLNYDCRFDVIALDYLYAQSLCDYGEQIQQNDVNLQWIQYAYGM